MIDQETFERLLPLAYQWCKAQEEYVLASGASLGGQQMDDARATGVENCSRVRVLVVDRIALPESRPLAEAARRAQVVTETSRGVAIGHAIMIRADCWGDRELLVHNLVHVAQCERAGGLERWVREYLSDRRNCAKFTRGSFEEEACRLAREISAADTVTLLGAA